jgi:cytochrome c-type biogenesis protein
MGAAFGIGWTPGIGLFLGSLLMLAAQQDTVVQGTRLLLFYGFGLGVPFLLAGWRPTTPWAGSAGSADTSA